jgi:hypothetical protein
MSSPRLEAFLARLYTDERLLADFVADRERAVRRAGLSSADAAALERIDAPGLLMAARSIRAKRRRTGRLAVWLRALRSTGPGRLFGR